MADKKEDKIKEDAQDVINPPESWGDVELKEESNRPDGPGQKKD